MTIASATVRVIGPGVSKDSARGIVPALLSSLWLGRWPTTPHSAAGQRTEPAVSVPIAATHIPAATAAAVPEDEPPVMRVGSHGFRAGPKALIDAAAAKGELVHVGLADDDCAGELQLA